MTDLNVSAAGISTEELLTAGGGAKVFIKILESNINGETINWHINDESQELGQSYVKYMTDTIERLDSIIDLDFALVSDVSDSYIDVNLYDHTGEDYAGICYTEYGNNIAWTEMEIIDLSSRGFSSDDNKNTFIHEFGHALGLGEPGYDNRWDQDDTAMSYNEGDIGWQTWYTESDLDALIYVWGEENDNSDTGPSDLNNDGFVDEVTNYQIWTASGGVDLTNRRGRTYSDDTSRMWDAVKVVEDDGGFSVLVEGQRNKDGKFKVASASEEGVIGGATRWLNADQMFDGGYEDLFAMDFNSNNQIGFQPQQLTERIQPAPTHCEGLSRVQKKKLIGSHV